MNRGFSPTPNPINITKEITNRQVIGGEDFGRYESKIKEKYLIESYSKSRDSIAKIKNKEFVGIQRIRTNSLNFKSRWLVCQLFEKGYVPIDSISFATQKENLSLKYLLALLNSTLLNIYYKLHYTDKNVKPIYLLELPIPEIETEKQNIFENIVNQILSLKQADPQADTSTLEKEIDKLVYELYGLTEEEIRVVEGE